MDLIVNELETVKQKIAATEVKLVKAEEEGDIPRRNRLEYILELQKKENRLSQSAGVGAGGESEEFQLLRLLLSPFKNMPKTLDVLFENSHQLTGYLIPDEVLAVDDYCRAPRNRASAGVVDDISSAYSTAGVVDDISSAYSTAASGELKLSNFRLSDLAIYERPKFVSFSTNESNLEELVKGKFPGEDFEAFLTDHVTKLGKLRAIIYSVKLVGGISDNALWNESRLQMLLQLFLDDMLAAWFKLGNISGSETGALLRASSATGIKIPLDVRNCDGEEVRYSGSSDILVQCDNDIGNNAASPVILEMKVAFGEKGSKLYKSEGRTAKQQLLGQSMGMLQASSKSCVLSYLTDVMALSVLHLSAGKEIREAGIAHLSNRITDGKQYYLLLLLMCFDISESDWIFLGVDPNSQTEVNLEDEETVNTTDLEDKDASTPAMLSPIKTRSGKGSREGGGAGKVRFCCGYEDGDAEAKERRLAEISNMRKWQAKRTGVPFFGLDELHNMSSASKWVPNLFI